MIRMMVTLECAKCEATVQFPVEPLPWARQDYAPVLTQLFTQMLARQWSMDGGSHPDVDRIYCPECTQKRREE